MNQIVLTVNKVAVQEQRVKLYNYMSSAKEVTTDSNFRAIRKAEAYLNKAKGVYETLRNLDLLDDFSVTYEDIERMEIKLRNIIDQRRIGRIG